EAGKIVPFTFFIIIGTVVFYGVISLPLARFLGITIPEPQGLIFVGAHTWARKIALELKRQGLQVIMVDSNKENAIAAEQEGLVSYCGNILDDKISDEMDLSGVGNIFALTSNEEANSLALIKYKEVFGRKGLYHLPVDLKKNGIVNHGGLGRILFGSDMDYSRMEEVFSKGAEVITMNHEEYSRLDNMKLMPIGVIDERGKLHIRTSDHEIQIKDKYRILCILNKME
ncbi:MAG: NAD-binding protein, partial [Victivallales bacterium]